MPAIALAVLVCRHPGFPFDERAGMDGEFAVVLDVGLLIVEVLVVARQGVCGLNGEPESSSDGGVGRIGIRAEVALTVLASVTATGGDCAAEALRHAAAGAAIPERFID